MSKDEKPTLYALYEMDRYILTYDGELVSDTKDPRKIVNHLVNLFNCGGRIKILKNTGIYTIISYANDYEIDDSQFEIVFETDNPVTVINSFKSYLKDDLQLTIIKPVNIFGMRNKEYYIG